MKTSHKIRFENLIAVAEKLQRLGFFVRVLPQAVPCEFINGEWHPISGENPEYVHICTSPSLNWCQMHQIILDAKSEI